MMLFQCCQLSYGTIIAWIIFSILWVDFESKWKFSIEPFDMIFTFFRHFTVGNTVLFWDGLRYTSIKRCFSVDNIHDKQRYYIIGNLNSRKKRVLMRVLSKKQNKSLLKQCYQLSLLYCLVLLFRSLMSKISFWICLFVKSFLALKIAILTNLPDFFFSS